MPDKKARLIKCPVCRKPAAWEGNPYRPFCGERCSVIDLGNWADEKYRIENEIFPVDGKKEEE